jgi:hypothetical protein
MNLELSTSRSRRPRLAPRVERRRQTYSQALWNQKARDRVALGDSRPGKGTTRGACVSRRGAVSGCLDAREGCRRHYPRSAGSRILRFVDAACGDAVHVCVPVEVRTSRFRHRITSATCPIRPPDNASSLCPVPPAVGHRTSTGGVSARGATGWDLVERKFGARGVGGDVVC